MMTPRQLQQLYNQGINITQKMREDAGLEQNTDEIIELAYELQTGSYIQAMERPEICRIKQEYSYELAKTITGLCQPASILEAGVGEGTALSGVLKHLPSDTRSYGFDLSWSRTVYARQWLERNRKTSSTTLFTGNLLSIPMADESVDVVYTSHSIEPNGGKEAHCIRELFRVARKYVILLEPGYELASKEAQSRMDMHGYCRDLKGTAERMGRKIVHHGLFPVSANPLNPTAVTIIEKLPSNDVPEEVLVCPKFKTPLERLGEMFYSPEALSVYPILLGIPCLQIENAIFACKFREQFDQASQ